MGDQLGQDARLGYLQVLGVDHEQSLPSAEQGTRLQDRHRRLEFGTQRSFAFLAGAATGHVDSNDVGSRYPLLDECLPGRFEHPLALARTRAGRTRYGDERHAGNLHQLWVDAHTPSGRAIRAAISARWSARYRARSRGRSTANARPDRDKPAVSTSTVARPSRCWKGVARTITSCTLWTGTIVRRRSNTPLRSIR